MAATNTTTTTTTLSMKLLIDRKAQRLLFAEASKDVVDFLCSLLVLPVGAAVKLLGKEGVAGSVGSLYGSVEGLDYTYIQPGAAKDALLRPAVLCSLDSSSLLRLLPPQPAAPTSPNAYGKACPTCGNHMTAAAQYLPPAAGGQMPVAGFVRGVVTYTVMDNLTVMPMSAISSFTLLNAFAVTDLAALQEKTVQLGYNEGLEILRASLQSKTVLSDVFLGRKGSGDASS
ncbi:uncharacterized protein LOC8059136 [Sorghum bicolor]|uniref:uncharacterized protein LOC8059136 n=1 Tax=Sorghum bicolor TaxID=4558 RepID=UPI000B425B75|nr:uncharacterized protein LOC8059136 [Sorghum bicolor]|eukprot:XP_021311747.1 uncharacterized protein LOC8059136 [Sorghum bicolor]